MSQEEILSANIILKYQLSINQMAIIKLNFDGIVKGRVTRNTIYGVINFSQLTDMTCNVHSFNMHLLKYLKN